MGYFNDRTGRIPRPVGQQERRGPSAGLRSRLGSRWGARRRALSLEGLEGRVLLSGDPTLYTVNSTGNGSSGTGTSGTLPYVITQANANPNPAGSLIEFDPAVFSSPQTITLANTLTLTEKAGPEVIDGPGADLVTISGNQSVQVFQVNSGVTATISGLIITGGIGSGSGGAISNTGTLSISGSTLSGNSAGGQGGAIDNEGGTLSISDSTLSGNVARAQGGAICNNSGTLSISDSTFSGNWAAGSTGVQSRGGAIYTINTLANSRASTVSITASTLADNTALSGGGIATYAGSGPNQVVSIDSIFQNGPGGNISVASGTTFRSLGHNLFSDSPDVNLDPDISLDPTDLINTDPLLGSLAPNGGPTDTMALLPGSPAIDAGTSVSGVTTDQRGISRPQGSAPDIGAFESRGFTVTIASGDDQTTSPESPFPTPLIIVVASPFGEPVAGGRVTFTAPTAGASAELAGTPATIDSSGRATIDAFANGQLGTYTVSAPVAGAQGVAFTLTNALPTVLSLKRFGFHEQPTQFVLTFNSALDTARAQDVRNYSLAPIGPRGQLGRKLRIISVVYDPLTATVAIHPATRVSLFGRYRLEVNGTAPDGLASPSGTLLDGQGNGEPGSDYVKIFGPSILSGPYRGFPTGTSQKARRSHADPTHSTTRAPRPVPHAPRSTPEVPRFDDRTHLASSGIATP
jgi:hypothetical protein